MWKKVVLSFVAVAVLVVTPGCIFSPDEQKIIDEPPTPPPPNNTPQNTIRRFIRLYEDKNAAEYDKLFTNDYIFEFSNSTDPDLVNKFSAGWFREDERVSSTNLFQGGVNSEGEFQQPANTIDLNLDNTVPSDDNGEGRDPTVYKRLATGLNLTIQLPPSAQDPEGTTFVVGGLDPAFHRFFLVRGDQLDSIQLDENQAADDTHWYIWKWRDESTVSSPGGGLSPQQHGTSRPLVKNTSFGQIKSMAR